MVVFDDVQAVVHQVVHCLHVEALFHFGEGRQEDVPRHHHTHQQDPS